MIEKIHLYDQALAFIREDAHKTVVNDSGIKNINGGTAVNAWEVLAHEFEYYWRHVIGEEVTKLLETDPRDVPPVTFKEYLLATIWKEETE